MCACVSQDPIRAPQSRDLLWQLWCSQRQPPMIRELRTWFRKLGRQVGKYKDQSTHGIHAEYKDAHRKYNKAIKYNKRHHWRDWLEKATDPDLWTANKYISSPASDRGKTRIPSLRQQIDGQERTANSNQDSVDHESVLASTSTRRIFKIHNRTRTRTCAREYSWEREYSSLSASTRVLTLAQTSTCFPERVLVQWGGSERVKCPLVYQ